MLSCSLMLGVLLGLAGGPVVAQQPNPTFSMGVVAINDQPVQKAPVTTVTVSPGDVINAELYVRDWSPVGDDLRAYQIQLDESSFTSGTSGSIKPVGYDQSLKDKADNSAGAFIDLNHEMFVHKGLQTIALTDTKNARGYRWLSVLVDIDAAPISPEDGTLFYCGSVNLAVSSDASGEFTLKLVADPQVTGLLKDNNRPIGPIDYESLKVIVKSGVVRYRVVDTSPPDGAIDPRILSASPTSDAAGWKAFKLTFDTDSVSLSRSDFQVSDGSTDPPMITDLKVDGAKATVTLDRAIRSGAWTTLTYVPSGFTTRAALLPGDVNGDGRRNSSDLTSMLDGLNSSATSSNLDITGDGALTVADSLSLIDLLIANLNGALSGA